MQEVQNRDLFYRVYSNEYSKYNIIKNQYPEDSEIGKFIRGLIATNRRLDICSSPLCEHRYINKTDDMYMAFDGAYCSRDCKNKAIEVLSDAWSGC